MSDEQLVCGKVLADGKTCLRTFKTPRALGIHRASHERATEVCPKCQRSVRFLSTHLRRSHSVNVPTVLAALQDMVDELERLRRENDELRASRVRA